MAGAEHDVADLEDGEFRERVRRHRRQRGPCSPRISAPSRTHLPPQRGLQRVFVGLRDFGVRRQLFTHVVLARGTLWTAAPHTKNTASAEAARIVHAMMAAGEGVLSAAARDVEAAPALVQGGTGQLPMPSCGVVLPAMGAAASAGEIVQWLVEKGASALPPQRRAPSHTQPSPPVFLPYPPGVDPTSMEAQRRVEDLLRRGMLVRTSLSTSSLARPLLRAERVPAEEEFNSIRVRANPWCLVRWDKRCAAPLLLLLLLLLQLLRYVHGVRLTLGALPSAVSAFCGRTRWNSTHRCRARAGRSRSSARSRWRARLYGSCRRWRRR